MESVLILAERDQTVAIARTWRAMAEFAGSVESSSRVCLFRPRWRYAIRAGIGDGLSQVLVLISEKESDRAFFNTSAADLRALVDRLCNLIAAS